MIVQASAENAHGVIGTTRAVTPTLAASSVQPTSVSKIVIPSDTNASRPAPIIATAAGGTPVATLQNQFKDVNIGNGQHSTSVHQTIV